MDERQLLPPAWEALHRELNHLPGLFGQAGVRDPDYPCAAFEPLPEGVERPSGDGHCYADGHYLCRECTQLSADSPDNWPDEWRFSGDPGQS